MFKSVICPLLYAHTLTVTTIL